MSFKYDYSDLENSYRSVGLSRGRTVYLTGNFGRLGSYESKVKEEILEAHFQAIFSIIGEEGTLVVPTHSFSLVNTSNVFDYKNTPSETGPFSEYIRRKIGSVRQFHPFSSSTAIGRNSKIICGKNPRNVYGPRSPFDYMVKNDALFVSVGMEINKTISLVHHAEFMMGVPYRYTKEFNVDCVLGKEISNEKFYLYALYRECDISRDKNVKIMESYRKHGVVNEVVLGASKLYSVSMLDFYDHLVEALTDDIYVWLKEEPTSKPYLL